MATQDSVAAMHAASVVKKAQHELSCAEGAQRTGVLRRAAQLLEEREAQILLANRQDLQAAKASGLARPLQDRLGLNTEKLTTLRDGLIQLAEWEDPIGNPISKTELEPGLVLTQVKSSIGVLLIIFESRPDALIQIGGLAIRSGNGVLLKGGSEAVHSNRALAACLRDALKSEGFSPDCITNVEGREAVGELLELESLIDLVIPRGSSALVRSIKDRSRIPVLGHAEGICHMYLDASADLSMAAHLVVDSKCSYPSACNALETLLVHESLLPGLRSIGDVLAARGVELRADARCKPYFDAAKDASDEDWSTEYGDLILSVRSVASAAEAMDHIKHYGSGHTDCICTENKEMAEGFLNSVDSASVFWNASTRFADGFRYGLGAEVGISTSRIHARGPVGIEGLLTTRWQLRGHGQASTDFGAGKRSFTHRRLDLDS